MTTEPAEPELPSAGATPNWTPFEREVCRRDGCGDERHRHTHNFKLGTCTACNCTKFRAHRTPVAWVRHVMGRGTEAPPTIGRATPGS